jgi:NAD(P) transhydrogenase subunit alpha
MTNEIITLLTVFMLSVFVGFEVISKVPSILHTPLMSGTNAVHGVVLVGAMLVLGTSHSPAELALGFLAVVLATLNVVGGFVVTDRMLEMFKGRQPGRPAQPQVETAPAAPPPPPAPAAPPAPEQEEAPPTTTMAAPPTTTLMPTTPAEPDDEEPSSQP